MAHEEKREEENENQTQVARQNKHDMKKMAAVRNHCTYTPNTVMLNIERHTDTYAYLIE